MMQSVINDIEIPDIATLPNSSTLNGLPLWWCSGIFFMREKIIGIYKITNPKGRIYIGQSTDIYARWNSYKSENCKTQILLYNSLKKHGWDAHAKEIFLCEESKLNELEIYYIQLFQTLNSKYGMNCRGGGNHGGKHSDKTKELLRIAKLGKPNSQQSKDKVKKTAIERGFGKWMLGKKHSVESNRKKALFGEHHPTAKLIINNETGIYYYSIQEASESVQMPSKRLVKYLLGYRKNKTSFIIV